VEGQGSKLESVEELNDEAINPHAKHLLDKYSSEEVRSKIYLFDTYFFKLLERRESEKDGVKSRMKPVGDPFSKEHHVFPVHDEKGHHWILVIVDSLGRVKEADSRCVFRVFDSLCGREIKHFQVFARTMDFLNQAWSIQSDKEGERPFDHTGFNWK
jgi:Ulp1 family protease